MTARHRLSRLTIGLIAAALVVNTAGCENETQRLDRIQSAATAAGRAGTAADLQAAFDEGRITFEASLIRAETLLQEGHPDAVLFAGAVLDLASAIEDRLPAGPEFELFWRRIGRLAYNGAFVAMNDQRWDEAATLVLAGPTRWQRLSYWQTYPNHDVLVALSLGAQGEPGKGIARLRSRAIMTPQMQAAIDQLRELDRAQLRERLRARVESEAQSEPRAGSVPGG